MDRESDIRKLKAGFLAAALGAFVFGLAFYVSILYIV